MVEEWEMLKLFIDRRRMTLSVSAEAVEITVTLDTLVCTSILDAAPIYLNRRSLVTRDRWMPKIKDK